METVDDILRDIRGRAEVAERQDGDATVHHSAVAAMLRDIADRMEAAYKNLPGMWVVPAENAKLREENARLKAALKDAIPWGCLKCIFWNSCTKSCSRSAGACTQVLNWNDLLEVGAK